MNKRFAQMVVLLLSFGLWGPASGQTIPRKPTVAPTDAKPPKVILSQKDNGTTARTLTWRLRHDRRLNGSHIRVTAAGPRVGLYGTVPDHYQHRVAREVAQGFQGVTYVADHLRVRSPGSSPDVTAESVRRALRRHAATAGEDIRVTGYRSVVTLSGTVGTLRAKRAAIRLAHAIPHVAVVQDHLRVSPAGATGNALAADVRAALARDPRLRHRTFRVLASGRHVFLRGTVFSRTEKRRAARVASAVLGVRGLSDETAVLPARLKPRRTGRR